MLFAPLGFLFFYFLPFLLCSDVENSSNFGPAGNSNEFPETGSIYADKLRKLRKRAATEAPTSTTSKAPTPSTKKPCADRAPEQICQGLLESGQCLRAHLRWALRYCKRTCDLCKAKLVPHRRGKK